MKRIQGTSFSYRKNYSAIFFVIFILTGFILGGCTSPRTMINSGKVTPHGQLKIGVNYNANIPMQTSRALVDNIVSIADKLTGEDSISFNSEVAGINKSAIAFAIDPIGSGYEFYARYGVVKRIDVGYNFVSGVHVFDARMQFLGSTGNYNNPGEKGTYGSIGLQYSSQSFDFPKAFGMRKIQDLLGFKLSRKDLLIPVAFSNSFGPEEKYGCFSYGLTYGRTWLKYGFNPGKIYDLANGAIPQLIPAINEKKSFNSYGGFLSLKAGYKYLYVLVSLAVYHQNYGTYALLGDQSATLKGNTYVPAVGLQAVIPLRKMK